MCHVLPYQVYRRMHRCIYFLTANPESCCEEKALEGPILERLAVTIWNTARHS